MTSPGARLYCLLGAAMLALASLPAKATDNVDLIQRGKYLATAGDCVACHTAPGGKPMAGGLSLPTPLGPIVSTNITPSKTHGIGNYTLAQFTEVMRRGIRADGQRLYPAMPYTSYALITDADMQALYAWFMQAVVPVDSALPATHLPFPFNIRLSMAAWNFLFLDSKPFVPDASKSPEWNRGAYLARGLAHCSTCHTPRNMLMAEQASRELGGGNVGSWYAPNITSDPNSGIGGWSEQELADYMQLGSTAKSQAAGPMAEAIDHSLRHLSADDLRAIATYLKTVPPLHAAADTRPAYAWGTAADDLNSIRGVALPKDPDQMTGPQLYDAHCATCHQARGQGSFDGGLPPLFHNTTTGRSNTDNLVMVMLEGVQRQADSVEVRMPGFSKNLSDRQIATLGTYLLQRYGNPKAEVSVTQVRNLRAGGASSPLVHAGSMGIAAGVILLFGLGIAFLRRRRRKP
jgi:mono/diheme cytochrome c family protein